jgi:hypothetical protein
MDRYSNHAEEQIMSNQQKDTQSSGSTGDGGQGLRRKEKDDTGGPRGDELSNAVGAAAGGASKDSVPPSPDKGGASKV